MTGDEAIAWLKANPDKPPDFGIFWDVAERDDPATMDAILDILFRPRPTPGAA